MKAVKKLLIALVAFAIVLGIANQGIPVNRIDRQLIDAAENNEADKIKQLLQQGANVDSQDLRGRSALLIAVDKNHIETARLLIEAGADVNLQDRIQDSPLLLAGAEGTLEILNMILQANPDFGLYNRYGGTALIPACERGHVKVVKALLQTKTDINHVNYLGWTALMEAIVLSDGGPRHQQIVQMLVDAGADITIADNDGITPLQHAQQKGFTEIVKILATAKTR
ncbi:MAG: hypothetical protein G3M70_11380 [Candidatus Nitronauta litoralis]|uniref:Ankyrin repeat domain-containing protein n=1 Tax=Candidatus Nitronauta litoralis TaxID=2705533 RepID=A0A7T0BWY4_9BACT|nr:MAG: hypothetical protein G3M70_11380 [Candidatus Nitronauta litoralis]